MLQTVTTCKHDDNTYSLSMTFENNAINTSSFDFAKLQIPGHRVQVSLFQLTPQDMIDLADSIKTEAQKLMECANVPA